MRRAIANPVGTKAHVAYHAWGDNDPAVSDLGDRTDTYTYTADGYLQQVNVAYGGG